MGDGLPYSVSDQPTSLAWTIAENDDFQAYRLTDCPDCGSQAVEYLGSADGAIACRQCETGKDILKRKANYGDNWDRIRSYILERDGHTCEICGGADEPLHVHHKRNLVWFKSLKEAHHPANLETLCEGCHEHGP